MRRREFLKVGTAATVGMSAGLAGAEEATGKSEVYVGKGKADEILPKIIEKMGGMGRFVKKGARVLVKPNFSFANPPEWATTTSPEAVKVVAEMCLKAGAKRVIFCDHTLRDAETCKRKTGIGAAVKGMKGVVLYVPKQKSMYVEKSHEKATQLTRVNIVKEYLRADTFISLPIAKSHSAGGVSLGIKGLMGMVKDRDAYHREMDLHMAIAEQLYYMKPHLNIIDASRALLNNGPSGPGKVAELNQFVAGTDPVATDSFAVTLTPWYGRNLTGTNVKYLKNAAALGFGKVESADISEIAV